MEAQASGLSHQRRPIRAFAAILLGAFGLAATTTWMRPASGGEDVAAGRIATTRPDVEARVTLRCPECGVVVSTREVDQVGAANGSTGDDRDGVAGKSTASYEITVRMRDGSSRVFMDANPANWRPGDRMTVIEGTSRSKD